MKEDKAVKMWKIISPPIIYFFIQMIVELVFATVTIFLELTGIYSRYGIINNSEAVTERVLYALNRNSTYITTVSAILAIVIFGRMIVQERKKKLLREEQHAEVSYMILTALFAVLFSMAVSGLISSLQIDNIYGSYEETASNLLQGNIIYRLFAIGMLAPAAEELIYRGLVYNRAEKELGVGAAMIISSAAFGIFHFNLVQGVYAFLIGMACAWFYEKSGSLRVSICMHMAINIVAVLSDYYGLAEVAEQGKVFEILCILLEFVISIYIFVMINKKWNRKRGI